MKLPEQILMKNITVRCLVWILAAWSGSLGATLPAAATDGERPMVCVMNTEYITADLATSASVPDRHGNSDNQTVLDDRDVLDTDGATLAGLEDPQPPAAVGDVRHQRFAVSIDHCVFQSVSLVEPRFLRYCRLLN